MKRSINSIDDLPKEDKDMLRLNKDGTEKNFVLINSVNTILLSTTEPKGGENYGKNSAV